MSSIPLNDFGEAFGTFCESLKRLREVTDDLSQEVVTQKLGPDFKYDIDALVRNTDNVIDDSLQLSRFIAEHLDDWRDLISKAEKKEKDNKSGGSNGQT